MEDAEESRVRRAAVRLLERLEQAVEELDKGTVLLKQKRKTETGEETLELVKAKRKGIVDRAGLKQLTGVLKDLQDILSRDGSLDARERELRLQKIEQELGKGLHQAVFLLPYSMAGFLDTLHQNAKVLNVSYEASGIAVEAIVDEVLYGRLSAYRKE